MKKLQATHGTWLSGCVLRPERGVIYQATGCLGDVLHRSLTTGRGQEEFLAFRLQPGNQHGPFL